MRIGEVAAVLGLNIQTLRYYERQRLIDDPGRTDGGYRDYDDAMVARVRFIRRAQRAGFTLARIRELLALRDQAAGCQDVAPLAREALARIDDQLAELREMRAELVALLEHCDATGQCAVLDLDDAAP